MLLRFSVLINKPIANTWQKEGVETSFNHIYYINACGAVGTWWWALQFCNLEVALIRKDIPCKTIQIFHASLLCCGDSWRWEPLKEQQHDSNALVTTRNKLAILFIWSNDTITHSFWHYIHPSTDGSHSLMDGPLGHAVAITTDTFYSFLNTCIIIGH